MNLFTYFCIKSITHTEVMKTTEIQDQQERLFNDILAVKPLIQSLATWVQNDFSMMLEDGTVDKQFIIESIPDVVQSFEDVKILLSKHQETAVKILNHYSK